ncbi:TraR/DksA C4-type zinc finger protein [Thermomonas sp.]|uniref:TraR/DksA family transcriptional regulator n=1 Tax=Thermomonas sp. TaxID=1971895 RepID=UPI00257BB677|nr:TraR/DksA C4-type zinc finger protein [Thermomonas sp.]
MSAHVQSLDEFFSMLVEEQRDIRIALAHLERSGKPVALDQNAQGRVSRIDAISQQHMAKAGGTRLTIQLERIKAALERYSAGRYGICCRCELEIDHGRLMADPAAPFCMECTEELAEAKQHDMRRDTGR